MQGYEDAREDLNGWDFPSGAEFLWDICGVSVGEGDLNSGWLPGGPTRDTSALPTSHSPSLGEASIPQSRAQDTATEACFINLPPNQTPSELSRLGTIESSPQPAWPNPHPSVWSVGGTTSIPNAVPLSPSERSSTVPPTSFETVALPGVSIPSSPVASLEEFMDALNRSYLLSAGSASCYAAQPFTQSITPDRDRPCGSLDELPTVAWMSEGPSVPALHGLLQDTDLGHPMQFQDEPNILDSSGALFPNNTGLSGGELCLSAQSGTCHSFPTFDGSPEGGSTSRSPSIPSRQSSHFSSSPPYPWSPLTPETAIGDRDIQYGSLNEPSIAAWMPKGPSVPTVHGLLPDIDLSQIMQIQEEPTALDSPYTLFPHNTGLSGGELCLPVQSGPCPSFSTFASSPQMKSTTRSPSIPGRQSSYSSPSIPYLWSPITPETAMAAHDEALGSVATGSNVKSKCPGCGRETSDQRQHLRSCRANPNRQKSKCQHCGWEYYGKNHGYNLRRHVRRKHSGP